MPEHAEGADAWMVPRMGRSPGRLHVRWKVRRLPPLGDRGEADSHHFRDEQEDRREPEERGAGG